MGNSLLKLHFSYRLVKAELVSEGKDTCRWLPTHGMFFMVMFTMNSAAVGGVRSGSSSRKSVGGAGEGGTVTQLVSLESTKAVLLTLPLATCPTERTLYHDEKKAVYTCTQRALYVQCTYIVPTVRTMYVHCTYSARWACTHNTI